MTPAERIIVLLAALLASLALLIACTGCAHPTNPMPLHTLFETHMTPERPWCYVPEHPKAPDLPTVDSDNQDVVDRVYIHRRTYAEAIQYMHDLETWDEEVLACLKKVTE